MFYVYEWYIKDTGEIFYVGKGSGKRYKVTTRRNKLFTETIQKYDCESRIIKYFKNEKDAFKYEEERINELKEKGLCKCNIHSCGAGGSSEYWTDKLRQEYSINNPMKDPKQRKRMSEHNPMKNKQIAQKVAEKKSKRVIINNIQYKSIKEAQEHYHVSYETITNWCAKGINQNGELCRYADQEQVIFQDKRYNKGSSKAVIYKEKQYESITDLCKNINISIRACEEWLKRGFDPRGNSCRYLNDNRELIFQNRYTIRNKNRAKPIIVNGIKYKSCQQASQKLNISKSTLYSYLNGSRKNPKYICAYDNQQPS